MGECTPPRSFFSDVPQRPKFVVRIPLKNCEFWEGRVASATRRGHVRGGTRSRCVHPVASALSSFTHSSRIHQLDRHALYFLGRLQVCRNPRLRYAASWHAHPNLNPESMHPCYMLTHLLNPYETNVRHYPNPLTNQGVDCSALAQG